MKAFTYNAELERVGIELPGDVMVTPYITNVEIPGSRLLHSESTGEWFLTCILPDSTELCINHGTWLETMYTFKNLGYTDPPFKWGTTFSGRNGALYMPIWERVTTGEFDDDFIEKYTEKFSIVCVYRPSIELTTEEYNLHSTCNVETFPDLVSLVRALETYTGERF